MYSVELSSKCEKELSKFVRLKLISKEELFIIRTWMREMSNFGPEYIESCGYWNDHSLGRDRKGERASSFSESGRIIYRIAKNHISIKVIKISPDHDYDL